MEDAQEVQPMGVDPLKGVKLFIRIHHKSQGTPGLIAHKDHFLHPVMFACQQSTGLQRGMRLDVLQHFLPMTLAERESLLHYYWMSAASPQHNPMMTTGSMIARRAGWSSLRFMARLVNPYSNPVSINPNWMGERGQ